MSKAGRDLVKKLIIFDIDGTLRDERFGIPASAIWAINNCKANGHELCLCTGRSKAMIQPDILKLSIPCLIAGGGCYIEYDGNVLLDQRFQTKQIMQVLHISKANDCALAIETKTKVFMNEKACAIFQKMNKMKHKESDKKTYQQYQQNEQIRYENNLSQYDGKAVHKICLWTNGTVFKQIQRVLQTDMMLAQSDTYENMQYYEIICRDCGKKEAVMRVCNYLNIDQKQTIAFGDGMNDAQMLAYCETGIAMGNADVHVYPYADAICESVQGDGIYHELVRRKIVERKECYEKTVVAEGSCISDLSKKF